MYYGNPKGPSGDEIKAEYFANMERLTEAGRENILGIQGQLWSESVKGQELMEYMMFPKMISLAERAWAQDPSWAQIGEKGQYKKASDEAWNAFANTLGKRDLPRLEYLAADGKVNYRMPVPGAKISGDTLYANCELPGFAILYSSDKISWIKYSAPVAVAKGSVNFLKTLDVKGRESRIVEVR
jgi:hexosaminidase